jgi:hypothetical protein
MTRMGNSRTAIPEDILDRADQAMNEPGDFVRPLSKESEDDDKFSASCYQLLSNNRAMDCVWEMEYLRFDAVRCTQRA